MNNTLSSDAIKQEISKLLQTIDQIKVILNNKNFNVPIVINGELIYHVLDSDAIFNFLNHISDTNQNKLKIYAELCNHYHNDNWYKIDVVLSNISLFYIQCINNLNISQQPVEIQSNSPVDENKLIMIRTIENSIREINADLANYNKTISFDYNNSFIILFCNGTKIDECKNLIDLRLSLNLFRVKVKSANAR